MYDLNNENLCHVPWQLIINYFHLLQIYSSCAAAPSILLQTHIVIVLTCFIHLVCMKGTLLTSWTSSTAQVSAILGAVINVARLPEKLFYPKGGPEHNCRRAGPFDHWLNSHQLMHILVVCSMGFKYAGMREDYMYRLEREIHCPA